MNSLLLLAGLGAGFYLLSKRNEDPGVEGQPLRTLSAEEVKQLTPVQAKVEELQASGQLVTEVQEILTSSGQTATVIIAPTPEVPNRAIVVDPQDLARIQGYYVPKITITPDIQEQMSYHGYSNFDEFIKLVAANRVFFYGPAAMRIKFPLQDWEFWRTGEFKPSTALSNAVAWETALTQEEYNGLRDRYGVSGLGRIDRRIWQ